MQIIECILFIYSPHLSDEENKNIYGKCNNYWGHGHNYNGLCIFNKYVSFFFFIRKLNGQ